MVSNVLEQALAGHHVQTINSVAWQFVYFCALSERILGVAFRDC